MDTYYRPLSAQGRWPGEWSVLWPVALSEARNGPAYELHSREVLGTSKSPRTPASPKHAGAVGNCLAQVSSRIEWLVGAHDDSEERLFVFRIFESSNRTDRGTSRPLISKVEAVPRFESSWRASCKTPFCMPIAFNNMNESCGSKVRAEFVKARVNFQEL